MPEEYRAWDVINYLHSPKDAHLFLEAAADDDEGDGIEIRNAWSHLVRAHGEGKVSMELTITGERLCKELRKHGVYDCAIPIIIHALGLSASVAD